MDRIAVETTAVRILADGGSRGEIANKRGRLLEVFVGQLLGTQGYERPTRDSLNVTSEGAEIDVVARHRVTGQAIVCECKAHSSNVGVPHLSSFIGKFTLARADDPGCQGIFVGLPRLTSDANEKARSAEKKISGFRYLGSLEVCRLLEDAGLLPSLSEGPKLKADPTLLITEHGLALAARELDASSRRAFRVVVWSQADSVPEAILSLVDDQFADGLPVIAHGFQSSTVPIHVAETSTVVEVQGSSSDFEYQLPAAPAFFVGRKSMANDLTKRICARRKAGVLVINAKSGWGKSSLSLRLKDAVEKAGGVALVVDTRTAERPDFATVALEQLVRAAVERKIVVLPEGAAFSSVASILETLRQASWPRGLRPIFIGFDQFENAFRSFDLTREFRDLSYTVKSLDVPLTVGFSWKTDMVGWTEEHPYRLRDEIREVAHVAVLEPFGPREVETLLRRLEKEVGERLHRELRQRLREYSQGLPWLLKKLAAHILAEVKRGATQETLVREALNVQSLFETDLARLGPAEQEALRAVARAAPVLMSELDEEVIPSRVLESLLHHQRLVVQVGERLDIYWDTFRDFLNTGRVAIEDSYIVRYAPLGAGRLLRAVLADGGAMTVQEAAARLNTSATVVFNYARELRLFGVLTPEANRVVVEPAILAAEDREEVIRGRVAHAFRRHKMHTLALAMVGQSDPLPVADLAAALPSQFPTIEAKPDSWLTYARSFCQWLDYSGLMMLGREGLSRSTGSESVGRARLLSGVAPVRVRSAFPGANPGPALRVLRHLSAPDAVERPGRNGFGAAVRDLSLLGAIEMDARDRISLSDPALVEEGAVNVARLRELVVVQRGMSAAFTALEADPSLSPMVLGEQHRSELGADWVGSTTLSVGKYIRAWARACGIPTRLRPDPVRQEESLPFT